MMDAMIARAEALCERGRAQATRMSGIDSQVAHRRRKGLQTMEDTLARLKAERDQGSP